MGDVTPHLPHPSEDAELHPGDFVVLIESDPYLVGNHPVVADAYRLGRQGRVCQLFWKALTETEARAIGKTSDHEVSVKFPGTRGLFVFWKTFLRKVARPLNEPTIV